MENNIESGFLIKAFKAITSEDNNGSEGCIRCELECLKCKYVYNADFTDEAELDFYEEALKNAVHCDSGMDKTIYPKMFCPKCKTHTLN